MYSSNPVERNVMRPSCMVGGIPTINTAISHWFLMTAVVCNDFRAALVEASRGVRNKDGVSMGSPFVARRFPYAMRKHMAAMGTLISPTQVAEHPLKPMILSISWCLLWSRFWPTVNDSHYDCVWFMVLCGCLRDIIIVDVHARYAKLVLIKQPLAAWPGVQHKQFMRGTDDFACSPMVWKEQVESGSCCMHPKTGCASPRVMIICCAILVCQCLLPILTSCLVVVLISYHDCCYCWSCPFCF